jgi:F-type H+-transporting ATPase subunit a
VHHEVSFLFHRLNALLVGLLGAPPAGWQRAMGLEGESGIWLPDHVIMAMLVVIVVAVLLFSARRRYSVEHPSTVQQVLELLLSALRNLRGRGRSRRGKDFVLFIAAPVLHLPVEHLRTGLLPAATDLQHQHDVRTVDHRVPVLQHRNRRRSDRLRQRLLRGRCGGCSRSVPIEIISHLARVLSLALRLFGNIFGEHTATLLFLGILPFFVPAMIGLGLLGAIIQTFIFIMLTAVYVSGAVAEEH